MNNSSQMSSHSSSEDSFQTIQECRQKEPNEERARCDLFFSEGFITEQSMISESDCEAVFNEMKSCWANSKSDYIHCPKFRFHVPMVMTEINIKVMKSVLSSYKSILDKFLAEEHMQWLVEFSSICTFPGAKGQKLHRDMSIQDRRLVTIFINLLDVGEKSGPLLVIAGSQKNISESHKSSPRFLASEDYRVMTLPKGSSVLMDSRVVHSGTANTSHDCMRPVFYFSFGEKDISGPTYSIRSEYSGKYKLNDFCN